MDMTSVEEVYERVIYQDESNTSQVRLVINNFRGTEYLHLRKYYLAFEGEWHPTPQGIAIPLEMESSIELFKGIAEIMSLAESKEVIEEFFGDTIREIYKSS
jgi:hypothetical protein